METEKEIEGLKRVDFEADSVMESTKCEPDDGSRMSNTVGEPDDGSRMSEDLKFELREGERLDDLQRDNLKIIQNPSLFCFGIDAVLLSAFAKAKRSAKILDMCSGNGIIPILLSSRLDASHITALELQKSSCSLANRSVQGNNLQDLITVVQGDVKDSRKLFGYNAFDAITVNPPYIKGSNGLNNPNEALNIARHEIYCSLEDIARESAAVLKPGGKIFMIHKPFRLVEIFDCFLKYKLEPKRLRFIQSKADSEPSMVLVEAALDGGRELKVMPPLIIYKDEGGYTDEVLEIYGVTR